MISQYIQAHLQPTQGTKASDTEVDPGPDFTFRINSEQNFLFFKKNCWVQINLTCFNSGLRWKKKMISSLDSFSSEPEEQNLAIKSNSSFLNSLMWRRESGRCESCNLVMEFPKYFLFHLIFSSFIAN